MQEAEAKGGKCKGSWIAARKDDAVAFIWLVLGSLLPAVAPRDHPARILEDLNKKAHQKSVFPAK